MAPAVHGTIIVVDIAGFGDLRRTNNHQLALRRGLYRMLSQAFFTVGIPWEDCHREDRGDGVLIVMPPTVPKSPLVELLPLKMLDLLQAHNDSHDPEEQIRLRMSLHAGEIHHDEHGITGRAVNLAFRLVDASVLRQVLAQSQGPLAVITSAWFYEEVVSHIAAVAGYCQVLVEVKEVVTTAWVCLPGSSVQPASEVAAPALRQLPTSTHQFVGRRAEIGRLMHLLDKAVMGTVIITAIDGSAGIGKTALALHWAHQVENRFPDGHLHVNLRGFDPGEPLDAGQALHNFLQSLGVAPQSIPAELDAKAALYRSCLAGKRILIVLDNARSAEHVRPLLPGTPSCIVIITSRNRLESLVMREGAIRIALDVLSSSEANALLAKRVGEARVGSDPQAANEIIELCARLPLALAIAATRAAGYPDIALSTFAQELKEERSRLDTLDRSELDLSVRTVFSWTYNVLSPGAARLFRFLGVHPGPDIDVHASDALVGQPSRTLLNQLTGAHMLTEYAPGRYRFHDLLRAYAAELAERDPEWVLAVERALDFYLENALQADTVIQPCRDGLIRTPCRGITHREAMAWFARENMVLLAVITFSAERGFVSHAWRLAWACTTFLRRTGWYEERVAVHRSAAAAARSDGDRLGLATALRNQGRAVVRLGRAGEALDLFDEALTVFKEIGDNRGELLTQLDRAKALGRLERYAEALNLAQAIRNLSDGNRNDLLEADILHTLSSRFLAMRRYSAALPGFERALVLYEGVSNDEGVAGVLLDLGKIEMNLGRHINALSYYRRALALERQLEDRYYEAVVLHRLGDVYVAKGDVARGRQLYCQALAIFDEVHHSEAEVVRVKLE